MIKFLHRSENILAVVFIVLLGLFPTLEVLARSFFHSGILNSTEYVHYLVLILAFLGGTITSREKKHLSLSLELKLPAAIDPWVHAVTALLSVTIVTAIAWSSLAFIFSTIEAGARLWIIPLRIVVMAMTAGYAVMAARFVTTLPRRVFVRVIPAFGIFLGSLLALSSIVKFFADISQHTPALVAALAPMSAWFIAHCSLPIIVLLIVSAVFGTPIFVILGGIGYMLFVRAGQPLEIIPNQAFTLLTDHSIPAIPLFTFAGFILSESKAGERLVLLFRALFSWFPGGLAVVAILVCAFFTTFTGASGVTILALGALLSYVLINGNYDKKFSLGLLTAVGSVGLLFPPSLPIIIYGITAQVNIKHMFVAGLLPGFVLVLAMVLTSVFYARSHKIPRETFKWRAAATAIRESIWEILLPLVIMGCYFGGITTLVESGAIAVIYSLFIEMVVHRDIKISHLPNIMLKCMPVIGGVLTILALANGLAYYIVDAEIPLKLTAWIQAVISSKYVFLLLLNVALLIVGCFMDIFSATLVVVPLILPLGNLFGISPIHLGIIFLANMELGYLTPPVGLNLYLAAYRFEVSVAKISRYAFPFLLIQLAAVLLITYVPFLSMALLAFVK